LNHSRTQYPRPESQRGECASISETFNDENPTCASQMRCRIHISVTSFTHGLTNSLIVRNPSAKFSNLCDFKSLTYESCQPLALGTRVYVHPVENRCQRGAEFASFLDLTQFVVALSDASAPPRARSGRLRRSRRQPWKMEKEDRLGRH